MKGPAPYVVRVEATTQSRVNGAPAGTVTFLSILLNEIEGFIVFPQAWVPSGLCKLTVTFEGSVQLPKTKVFESASGWAVAKYDPNLIEGRVKRATAVGSSLV